MKQLLARLAGLAVFGTLLAAFHEIPRMVREGVKHVGPPIIKGSIKRAETGTIEHFGPKAFAAVGHDAVSQSTGRAEREAGKSVGQDTIREAAANASADLRTAQDRIDAGLKVVGVVDQQRPHGADEVEKALRSSKDPQLARADWTALVSVSPDHSNDILVSAPADREQFRAVFGRDMASGDAELLARDLKRFGASELIGSMTPDKFMERIAKNRSPFVTIVGHNEGGFFALPNGSQLPISSIAEQCKAALKHCIILSCHSGRYYDPSTAAVTGITSEISYADAAVLAIAIRKRLGELSDQGLSYERVTNEVRALVEQGDRRVQSRDAMEIGAVPVIIGTGGVGAVAFEWQRRDASAHAQR